MQAVERLGSYISRGVYTVSGPFHPFGGAVDIIVVEQPDGSYKSSPWYVRFGKFQGVLKAREKVVNISVNGNEPDFHMYLDQRGEAYFMREVEEEEGKSVLSPLSSGDETDGQSQRNRRSMKSESCNYDGSRSNLNVQNDENNAKIMAWTTSRRAKILGLVFGRRSIKESSFLGEDDSTAVARIGSLERAEIAANLLDVQWSTNLAISKSRKRGASERSSSGLLGDTTNDVMDGTAVVKDTVACNEETGNSCSTGFEAGARMPSSVAKELIEDIEEIVSEGSSNISEVAGPNSSKVIEACPTEKLDDEHVSYERQVVSSTFGSSERSECDEVQSFKVDGSIMGTDDSGPHIQQTVCLTSEWHGEVQAETLRSMDGLAPEETAIYQHEHVDLTKLLTVEPIFLVGEVDSDSIFIKPTDDFKSSLESTDDSEKFLGDQRKGASVPASETSEEEQFLFSDLDEPKDGEIQHAEDKENNPSSDENVQEDGSPDLQNFIENVKGSSGPDLVPKVYSVPDGKVKGLALSLPNMSAPVGEVNVENVLKYSRSLDTNSESIEWKSHGKSEQHNSLIVDETNQSMQEHSNNEGSRNSEYLGNVVADPALGDPSKPVVEPDGNWGLWPFSRRRSRSWKNRQPDKNESIIADAEAVSENNDDADNDHNLLKPKIKKKFVRAFTPTSEQVASLNLKEGRNTVTFTFSTKMLGKQQVDARIYLWKWNTRIVISDVDGTITKSDVLGQFMPLVGVDWSQTGVAKLFSAIEENGYRLLFLSARAISQAYITRQFLVNLKQNGKALPDGPVVISPDGLFPSLFREVIRRVPQEFKIACLETIKGLFPPDYNPFYAGFGNRDTDEISYLKVGIPKGKIFTINPKGDVAVHRHVATKSYKSLHALVHDMFPSMKSSEQEDFNSWNFWKLPPPLIDI